MRLCVVSGKGGTGKTTISVGLAKALASTRRETVKLLDCDVEEPNAHLYIRPTQVNTSDVKVRLPQWDKSKCNQCGKCKSTCAYNAIALLGDHLEIFQEMCHSCGVCTYICPPFALSETMHSIGKVNSSRIDNLKIYWGELNIGEPRSVPVIEAVLENSEGENHVVIDGPPGTSCSLVAAATGSDLALVVSEPTPFGCHDLETTLEVLKTINVPAAVILNKAHTTSEEIYVLCEKRRVQILDEIPFDRKVARKGAEAVTINEIDQEWPPIMLKLWSKLETLYSERSIP